MDPNLTLTSHKLMKTIIQQILTPSHISIKSEINYINRYKLIKQLTLKTEIRMQTFHVKTPIALIGLLSNI